jgi:SAM-dependent methyltransferase
MTEFYDAIARFYDAENLEMTDDLLLYSELAATYSDPILDVGCGTGRVMLNLAQEGYDCVGIDTSPQMLARGRRKAQTFGDIAARVQFIEADVAHFQGESRFSLILLPYHAFMHFQDQAEQLKVLAQLKTNLAEDGRIVFDLPNAGEAFATQDEHALTLERTFIEPETGHLVMQQSMSQLDRATQKLYITWIYDEVSEDGTIRRTVAPLTLRYVFLSELSLLLKASGLKIEEIYGDYDRSAFGDGSPKMIVVARREDG